MHKKIIVTKHELKQIREEVSIGMFLSNLVMFAIIATSASTLYKFGIRDIFTADQAVKISRIPNLYKVEAEVAIMANMTKFDKNIPILTSSLICLSSCFVTIIFLCIICSFSFISSTSADVCQKN